MIVFATIFAKNYLAHVRTLMDSVARHHPEARRVALLVDRPDGCFDPAREDFEIVASDELPISNRPGFFFQYTVLEAATALKPLFLSHLLARAGVERLIYLDPDMQLFQPLDPVMRALDSCYWALTPHLTLPAGPKTERHILQSGAYNLGFLALRPGALAERLLAWWTERIRDSCFAEPQDGLFVDQRWMDLAPTLFSPVAILRDAGCNVAYWNLPQRPIKKQGTTYNVAQEPLRFFHFSGFRPDRPEIVSSHAPEMQTCKVGDAGELLSHYGQRLRAAGWENASAWPYSFGTFDTGQPIMDFGRRITRLDAGFVAIVNPFSAEGQERFGRFWTSALRKGGPSMLAWTIYRHRPDLQRRFPLVPGEDCVALASWLRTFGQNEYRIPPDLLGDTPLLGLVPHRMGGGTLSAVLDRLRLLANNLKRKG